MESDYKRISGWKWIGVYLIIGVILYGIVYYLFLMNKNPQGQSSLPVSQEAVVTGAKQIDIFKTMTDVKKGQFLTDQRGMTLYTFDKDVRGVSSCYDACAQLWPPFLVKPDASYAMPSDVTIVSRTDGSMQYSRQGMPLYFYSKDLKPGDINGDGFNGLWHLVKP